MKSSTTRSTSSTAMPTTPSTRFQSRAPPMPGPTSSSSATPTAARCPGARRRRHACKRLAPWLGARHPCAQRLRGRGRQHRRRGRRRRPARPRDDQRVRRALRQREPRFDHPEPAAQARLPCVPKVELAHLKSTSRLLFELLNQPPNKRQAYVGDSAFAHKGGVHVSAVMKNAKTYEHIDPSSSATVGACSCPTVRPLERRLQGEGVGCRSRLQGQRDPRHRGAAEGVGIARLRVRGGRGLVRAPHA